MAQPPLANAAARKRLVRDLLLTGAVFAVVVGGLLGYTRTWPPMATVASGSMAHAEGASEIGVMDPGDIVLVQAVGARSDAVTYLEGRGTGYRTYADFGDVLLFRPPGEPEGTVYLHRAMAFIAWNASAAGYDVPDLGRLTANEWIAWDASGNVTASPYGLSRFLVHHTGWRGDLDIAFNLTAGDRSLALGVGSSGFLTMGDQNAYATLTKADRWVVTLEAVLGVARGEVPWFGLIQLTLAPDPDGCCAGWGSSDPVRGAPANSWAALDATLILLAAIPVAWFVSAAYLDRHPDVRQRIRQAVGRLRFWQRDMGVKPAKEIGPPEESAAPIRPSEIPAPRAPAGRFPRTSPAQVVQEWLNSRDATPPRRPGEAERERPPE